MIYFLTAISIAWRPPVTPCFTEQTKSHSAGAGSGFTRNLVVVESLHICITRTVQNNCVNNLDHKHDAAFLLFEQITVATSCDPDSSSFLSLVWLRRTASSLIML